MSAIFGKYNLNNAPIEHDTLHKMHEVMRHWIPDDEGLWFSDSIGLGHLMLHNSPESLHEKQPLHDAQAHLTIVADAVLYNRDELFRQLNITTAQPELISDSYLILESYKKWSEKCCEHFNGDFAFVIWDARKQQIYCGRDHIGVRPFFYFYSKEYFAFASQLRGVLCIPGMSDELNDDYIFEFLYDGYPHKKTTTFYKHIFRLEPAHYVIVTKDSCRSFKYWALDPNKEIRYPKEEDYVEEARYLLRQAVESRMRTAFPVGAQLSGGLDSSGISYLGADIAREKGLPFSVYCNVMPEELLGKVYPYTDDRELIQEVCKAANITNINYIDFKDKDIDFFVKDPAGKYADIGYMTFFKGMTKAHCGVARFNKVRTLLSGLTGDEIVTSTAFIYFSELLFSFKWKTLFDEIKTEKEYSLSPENRIKNILKIAILNHFPGFYNLLFYLKNTKSIGFNKSFVNFENIPEYITHSGMPFFRFSKLKINQIRLFQDNNLTTRIETECLTATNYGIDKRYPLSDKELLNYFLNIPSGIKRRNGFGRFLYRKSFENLLTDSVVNQVKCKSQATAPAYNDFISLHSEKLALRLKSNINISQSSKFIDLDRLINVLEDIMIRKNKGGNFTIINTIETINYLQNFN